MLEKIQRIASQKTTIAVAVAALTLITFIQVAGHGFLDYDDWIYVTQNKWVLKGLNVESIQWAFTSTEAGFWHPLTWLSHMADVEFFGLNPAGHHVSALFIHTGSAVILFLVLHAMTDAPWRSALVAALFAVHPLHVESAAWISERKDLLSAFIWMLGMAAYHRYAKKPNVWRYLAVLTSFAAALAAKTMAITLPFVFLLLDIWPLSKHRPLSELRFAEMNFKIPGARAWLEKLPLFLLIIPLSFASYSAQTANKAINIWNQHEPWVRAANASVSYVAYLFSAFFPINLSPYYLHPGVNVSIPIAIVGAFFMACASIVAVLQINRRPWLAVGWFWYLGVLIPVIGIIPLGQFARADRFTYLPLVGIFIIVVWGANELLDRLKAGNYLRAAIAATTVISCACISWTQLQYWRNDQALWSRALEISPENYYALYSLGGVELDQHKNPEKAVEYYRQAINLNPNFLEARQALTAALKASGREAEALAEEKEVEKLGLAFQTGERLAKIERNSDAEEKKELNPKEYNNAGAAYARAGKYKEAETAFRKALQLEPNYAGAHYNLGNLLYGQGKTEEAFAEYVETLRIDPNFADAHLNLGVILKEAGELDRAAKAFMRALEIDPTKELARKNLGEVEAELK